MHPVIVGIEVVEILFVSRSMRTTGSMGGAQRRPTFDGGAALARNSDPVLRIRAQAEKP